MIDALLADRSHAELESMHEAAERLLLAGNSLFEAGQSVVSVLMPGKKGIEAWTHYPRNDVLDGVNGVQFYYHAHPEEDRGPKEHGHFHVFVYPQQPSSTGGAATGAGHSRGERQPTHLIGISMDGQSRPIGLFTTNRWVTGESWLPAGELIPCVRTFELDKRDPFPETREWLAAMVALFRPQIEKLIVDRDTRLASWGKHASEDALEDRSLNRISSVPVDTVQQIVAIEHKLGLTGPA